MLKKTVEKGIQMKTLLLIFTLSSVSLACKANYIDGPAGPCTAYMPQAEGATADESAKWTSDEKPPRNPQPAWQTGEVKAVTLSPINPADEHHPASCAIGCKWDGATCTCDSIQEETTPTGKKVKFKATAITTMTSDSTMGKKAR